MTSALDEVEVVVEAARLDEEVEAGRGGGVGEGVEEGVAEVVELAELVEDAEDLGEEDDASLEVLLACINL
jgi:hypothetical protein